MGDAMTWTAWWLFLTTETVLCLTPGPAVLYVLSSALRAGPRKSTASSFGILAANTVYFILSASSLGAVLMASYDLFFAVKWIGAAYLIYLGLRSIFGRGSVLDVAAEPGPVAKRASRLFADGFVIQMSNPKALIFFTALLPQFINPHAAVATQVAILALTSVVIEFCVLTGYGIAAGKASYLARQPRYATWTNRVAGGLLVGAGTGLATLRR